MKTRENCGIFADPRILLVSDYVVPVHYDGYIDQGSLHSLKSRNSESAKAIQSTIDAYSGKIVEIKEKIEKIAKKGINVTEVNVSSITQWKVLYYFLFEVFTQIQQKIASTQIRAITEKMRLCYNLKEAAEFIVEEDEMCLICVPAFNDRVYASEGIDSLIKWNHMLSIKMKQMRKCIKFMAEPWRDENSVRHMMQIATEQISRSATHDQFTQDEDSYRILVQALETNFIGVRFRDLKNTNEQQLRISISILTKKICSFAEVPPEKEYIISNFCCRVFFDESLLVPLECIPTIPEEVFTRIRMLPLNSLGLNLQHGEMTPFQFFETSPILLDLTSEIITCLFMTNPFDIGQVFYKIRLALDSYMSSTQSTGSQNDTMIHLWTALILATGIPQICSIIEWFSKWIKVTGTPQAISDCSYFPVAALSMLFGLVQKNLGE